MSYTNQTANYGLPQYTADDKPTYLGDFNKAMLDIDTAIKNNENIAQASKTLAQNANNSASEALSTANTASSSATNAGVKADNAYALAESAKADATQASTDATDAKTIANSANQTATSAKINSETAVSTANSAQSTANSTKTALDNLTNFTTQETVIGKWIDNSTLYRKVFNIDPLTEGIMSITHNISQLDFVTNLYGTFIRTDGVIEPMPKIDSASEPNNCHIIDMNSTTLRIKVGSNFVGAHMTIVCEYTKNN